MKKEIHNAYETIKPDAAAKERMLANILTAASDIPDTGKEFYSMKKQKKTHKLQLAAALALAIIIPAAAAYATNLFGLHSISMGKIVVEDPLSDVPEREVDIISLQGISDSPEAKACMEWARFYLEEYDKDGSILSEIGNGPSDVDPRYRETYNCYTQEMVDKVDEICEKYQLSILENPAVGDYEEVCGKTGIGKVCSDQTEGVHHFNNGGYFYEDGTLHMEGSAYIDEDPSYAVGYQLMRSMKGSFCPYILNIENVDDYEQWEYTTANGETMLLAISDFKALIIEEKEESCIVVNILDYNGADKLDISCEALEKLADSFDFSAVL